MKCVECGNELDPKAKFCPECGRKIISEPTAPEEPTKADDEPKEVSGDQPEETPEEETAEEPKKDGRSEEPAEADPEDEKPEDENRQDPPPAEPPQTDPETGKKKGFFTFVCGLTIAVMAVLLFAAVVAGDSVARFLAFTQVSGAVLMLLMHQNVVKLGKSQWIKYVLLLMILALAAYSVWGYMDQSGNTANVNQPTTQTTVVPTTGTPITTTIPTNPGLPVPYDANQCVGMPYEALVTDLEKAGFTNIRVETVEDLDYARSDELDTVSSIKIAGSDHFTRDDAFEPDAQIVIVYHLYQKCEVIIRAQVEENLIFSKYDVNLLLNGEEKGTMDHGTGKDFTFLLDPGVYTVTFASDEYTHVDRDVELLVDCDLEVSYDVSCGRDQISVEMRYIDRKVALKQGQIKLDTSASDYEGQIYTDVATSLEDQGFTNITYQVMYDIFWGITPNGSVESVSIAGDRDFVRGETYASDSEIVITYHMPEEDDPAYAVTQPETTTAVE